MTRPSDEIIRCASELADISMLNTATGSSSASAACSAILSAKAVLPIEGLPAIIIRSPFCKPAVKLSSSLKPDETPVSPPPPCALLSNSSYVSLTRSLIIEKAPFFDPRSAISKIYDSAISTNSVGDRPSGLYAFCDISLLICMSSLSKAFSLIIFAYSATFELPAVVSMISDKYSIADCGKSVLFESR